MLVLSSGGSFVIFGAIKVQQHLEYLIHLYYFIMLLIFFHFIYTKQQQNIHIINCYISSASVHVQ